MFSPRQQQGIDQPVTPNRLSLEAIELGVDEADVERRIVNYQRRVGDEFQELVDYLSEQRLAGEKLGGQAMHGKRFGRHVALGIDVAVKSLAGRHPVVDLDAADLDQAVAAQGIEAGGFGIENDFAHESLESRFSEPQSRRIRLAVAAS